MKKILIFALICATASLASCDKIKDATSRDFTVNNVKLDFTAITKDGSETQAVMLRSGTVSSFSVTRTVDLSEMGSEEMMEYASKISKVVVNASLVSITMTPSENYTISDLKISADGVPGSLVIPSYTIGDQFTAPSDMETYMAAFIMKLLSTKSLSVTVSGQSDAPAETVVNIRYENDIVLTASAL